MNKILLAAIGLGSLVFVGCGGIDSKESQQSETKNIVSPIGGPVRSLISNLSIGRELGVLITNFGYLRGNNCFQHISNQRNDGTTFETVEMHEGDCRAFPIENQAVAKFRLKVDNSVHNYRTYWLSPIESQGVKVSGYYSVGRVKINYPFGHGGYVTQLCSLHFSETCDLNIDGLGTMKSISLK